MFDPAKPYFAYVLWSDSHGVFYIGVSEDPIERLRKHNGGRGLSGAGKAAAMKS